jgi:hypothetical protein
MPLQVHINGLDLISVLDSGAEIQVESVTGWDGPTASTITATQRARRSGARVGQAFQGPRHVVIEGSIWVPSPELLVDAMDRFVAALPLEPGILRITQDDSTRWVQAQFEDDPLVTRKTREYATWSLQLLTTDWRRFGNTLSGATGLPASSGGFSFPLSFPLRIPATVASGLVTLTNSGNDTGPVRLRINGPVTGPAVRHAESGKVIALSPLLSLADGEYLVIDPERQEVLANGQASRNTYLTSRQWFGFEPGTNTYAFSAANNNTRALLSVEATEAWR